MNVYAKNVTDKIFELCEQTIVSKETRMMFIKHYAPNRCLCIKVAKLITGLRIAEMSQLQNCSVMCTKNGSYCENEKKREKVRGEGDVYK